MDFTFFPSDASRPRLPPRFFEEGMAEERAAGDGVSTSLSNTLFLPRCFGDAILFTSVVLPVKDCERRDKGLTANCERKRQGL